MHRLAIVLAPDTAWWSGVVAHAQQMPVRNGYAADLRGETYGNQAQPLLLSDRGHVLWSDAPLRMVANGGSIEIESIAPITLTHAGATLRDAYRFASAHYFPPSGRMPDSLLFAVPQYNTWIELGYDQNEAAVLRYARGIVAHGFPPGVLMIDDNWQEDYGRWRFHPGRFHTPRAMVDSLHAMGFKVMLWVCPFVSADADVARALARRGLLLRDDTGQPAIVRWWNGASALLDLSNPAATTWFVAQLDTLVRDYGIDGFKLDAGDAKFYTGTMASRAVTPNEQSALYGQIGLRYPLNEYRAMWRMGGQPLGERLQDKAHQWADLAIVVPQLLTEGLLGYPFTCPDMIGGGEINSLQEASGQLDQELIVRWAQTAALMPMMQFSAAPWRVLDSTHLAATLASVRVRSQFRAYLLETARDAARTGEPMVRSLEYAYPHQGYRDVADEFLLGERLLVAPVLVKGATARTVVVPPGRWRGPDGIVVRGPRRLQVSAPLQALPYFERVGS